MKNLLGYKELNESGSNNGVGYFITYHYYGPDGVESKAMAVKGPDFQSVARQVIDEITGMGAKEVISQITGVEYNEGVGIEEMGDVELNDIDDVMSAIDSYCKENVGNWNFFDYRCTEMNPRGLEESVKTVSLLDFSKVEALGSEFFSHDFLFL